MIRAVAERALRRVRVNAAIAWGGRALFVSLGGAAAALSLRKLAWISEASARVALFASVALVASAAAVAAARRWPRYEGARRLDRHHGLAGRLASALAFADEWPSDGSPFMEAAIEDGRVAAASVDPRAAVPLEPPTRWQALVALALGVALLSVLEVRRRTAPVAIASLDPVEVTADDLDAMREFLAQMQHKNQSDEAKAATEEFNQLIQDLANRRLDRPEAFRRMQVLDDKLLEGRDGDPKAFEDAMKRMAEELKKSELTKPLADALDAQSLPDAEKRARDLAKKLRERGKDLDKAQLERMREALKRASEDRAKRAEALQKRREELEKDLLQKKQRMADAGASPEDESLLKKRERELERLDREQKEQEAAGRKLDRLDRELAQAAEDLMKDLGLSAQDLDRAAEDINRMAREQMSQSEKEQLKKKLDDLRQMLRQQSQGGQGQMARLKVFQQRARGQGQQGQGEGQQGQGQQGQGQQGQGQQGQGQQGQGQQGQGQQGQGQQGQGQGQGPSETWVLGPNGEKMLLLTQGRGQGGGGQEPGGRGAGSGHDSRMQGKATNPNMGTSDTQVQGQDTGQGGSRSEVILGAAEKGFASRGYQRVFREYHTVAEEALDKDEIPGGYRSYVRRYFQLIRPREDGARDPSGQAPSPSEAEGANR